MNLKDIYKEAARLVATGVEEFSCHAIGSVVRASWPHGEAAHRLYVDLFSPTEPDVSGLYDREDDLLFAFGNAEDEGFGNRKDLRETALLFMAQIAKDLK